MPRHVRGMLLSELREGPEGHGTPELFTVRAVGSFHLAVLGWLPGIDEEVRDPELLAGTVEDVEPRLRGIGAIFVSGVVVREDGGIVGLDALYREGGSRHELAEEYEGSPVTLLRCHPRVPPARTAIHGSELVE